MREVRRRVCAGLHGDVVEIGFGTGLNAPYYPEEVTVVRAVEPSRVCMHLAESRIARTATTVEPSGLNGEKLDLSSEQFDAVLSTWTLCTIPNVEAALEEMRRVLKPGGAFHFVEHGRAPDAKTARWQDRLEPLNKRLAGGCHLTRNIPALIENAGFAISQIDTYYVEREPKPFAYTFEGRATKA
jgi:ubiquinone/menaquinone biosynthesis C-methylase UbiE